MDNISLIFRTNVFTQPEYSIGKPIDLNPLAYKILFNYFRHYHRSFPFLYIFEATYRIDLTPYVMFSQVG